MQKFASETLKAKADSKQTTKDGQVKQKSDKQYILQLETKVEHLT